LGPFRKDLHVRRRGDGTDIQVISKPAVKDVLNQVDATQVTVGKDLAVLGAADVDGGDVLAFG
jgi:hypothetical protein